MASRALQRKLTEKCAENYPKIYNKCFSGEDTDKKPVEDTNNKPKSASTSSKNISDDDVSATEATVSYNSRTGEEQEQDELNEEDAEPEPIEGKVNILESYHGPSGDDLDYSLSDTLIDLILNIPELMSGDAGDDEGNDLAAAGRFREEAAPVQLET